MATPLDILQKYWKHAQFRPLQAEIVAAVLEGRDTLALLPTGGGKSVCFQVPALVLDGICIVITPLIALMKDQVEQLKRKGIIAYAIHSGMSKGEVDLVLNNCIHGDVKFLYVSPERLQTEMFTERAKQMKVGLIAVDEAHCISQWGYDFRPPYLKISKLRDLKPNVPTIALTASATSVVQDDIVQRLEFRQGFAVFKKSFARDNLSFVVRKSENKEKKLLEILRKVKGTAIIYVRSRRATQEVAKMLNRNGVKASFYHAGMTFEQRTTIQEEWISNKTRVIVATNAFGMGIDKPDVRTVVHIDIPENLESYYQEAGRAGRDGLRSFAAILYQDADINNIRTRVEQSQPELPFLKRVYQALANYFQIALGSSEGESYDFDLHEFSERFSFNQIEVFNALKKLEEEGLIQFNESFYSPSLLHFAFDHTRLYQFQVANAKFDEPIKMLLRLYGGELFADYVKVSETQIAKSLNIDAVEVKKLLEHLHQLTVVEYIPKKEQPQLTFILPRQDADHLPVDVQRLNARRKLILEKLDAMINFVTSEHRCRMQMIQQYFDENTIEVCRICDICIAKRKKENADEYLIYRKEILASLSSEALPVEKLEEKLSPKNNELFLDVLREMVDEGVVEYDSAWRLKLNQDKRKIL